MDDTIEVRVELTQKEADTVAFALRCLDAWSWYKSEIALLKRVALKFQNATRDAECREAEDAQTLEAVEDAFEEYLTQL